MIGNLLKIGAYFLGKLGIQSQQGTAEKYVYMKRASFGLLLFFIAWALIDPESLVIRLERAAEIMPAWAATLAGVIFSGVWL